MGHVLAYPAHGLQDVRRRGVHRCVAPLVTHVFVDPPHHVVHRIQKGGCAAGGNQSGFHHGGRIGQVRRREELLRFQPVFKAGQRDVAYSRR